MQWFYIDRLVRNATAVKVHSSSVSFELIVKYTSVGWSRLGYFYAFIAYMPWMSIKGYFDVLNLTPAGTLPERLKNKSYNFKTQYTNVLRHF